MQVSKFLPKNIKDTIDAIFNDKVGLERFRKLPYNLMLFSIERLLTTDVMGTSCLVKLMKGIATPDQQTLFDTVASESQDIILKADKDAWMNFWTRIVSQSDVEGLKKELEMMKASRISKDAGLPGATTIKIERTSDDDTQAGTGDAGHEAKISFLSDTISVTVPGTSGAPSQFRAVASYLEHYLQVTLAPGAKNFIADTDWNVLYETGNQIFARKVSI